MERPACRSQGKVTPLLHVNSSNFCLSPARDRTPAVALQHKKRLAQKAPFMMIQISLVHTLIVHTNVLVVSCSSCRMYTSRGKKTSTACIQQMLTNTLIQIVIGTTGGEVPRQLSSPWYLPGNSQYSAVRRMLFSLSVLFYHRW